ncbi:MAG: trehalose-phosphatase, partial [Acidobacteriia bacterium]|nr:trehalose-phosphatase [Terriglobia bacterium]
GCPGRVHEDRMKNRAGSGEGHRRDGGLIARRRKPLLGSHRGSRHLFDRWAQVSARLRAARHVALFLDFDGTLLPLRRRPEDVWLDTGVRRRLARLARRRHVTVCLISGRQLADLRRRARVAGVFYLGLHGWEREGKARQATPEVLVRLKRSIGTGLAKLPGVWIEDKGFSLAIHYRGVPPAVVRRARLFLGECLKPHRGQCRLLRGKKVWEILPAEVSGKGEAARNVLARLGGSALPVYVGDDTTDEAAFEALRGGITVRVGPARRTKARYRLRNPQEVGRLLERLEDETR